ncbi:MAG: glycine cleavage system aminomethyltransferase GcvT [Gammaproteobacteria bacterium]
MPDENQSDLQRTPLYELHSEAKGRIVSFAGYELPLQYPDGIIKEHRHTREQAGLFDVSHMGQVVVAGSGIAGALEKLIPVDLEALAINQQAYTVFTNEQGGIMDDMIVTRRAVDEFFLVVNAACKTQDLAHLRRHLEGFEIEYLHGRGLLALQGPAAKEIMAVLAPAVTDLIFMTGCQATVDAAECFITRSGYTGEDGFEISVAEDDAERIARKLLSFKQAKLIGLGARDSLRLEAGLCLYGHDINAGISPIEAGLIWSISKSRRPGGKKEGGFPGADTILKQIADGVGRKRVGFLVEDRAPVREGAEIVDENGVRAGAITSGGFSPTIGAPVAMGYVHAELARAGTKLNALMRGRAPPVVVAKIPFVPQRYYRG